MAAEITHRPRPCWPASTKLRALLALAIGFTLLLRAIRLMDLFPILVDEAIYLRWAEIIQHRHNWFVSLLDAKPPLGYWLYALMRIPFPLDPLMGARIVSVLAGTLTSVVLYRIGFLCNGPWAGVLTALLYSALPFGVFYDHVAYIDSLMNLFSALLVYSSLVCFRETPRSWRRSCCTGLVLGLALFTKTTILLFTLAPFAIGWYLQRRLSRPLALHLLVVYSVAALFPLFAHFAVPEGPTHPVNSMLLHHTDFFTPAAALLADPLHNLRVNGPVLAGYAMHYLSVPTLLAALLSVVALSLKRRTLPLVILLACTGPIAFAAFVLEYFPSRYVFPHAWPLLLVIGCAAASPPAFRFAKVAVSVSMAFVLGIMALTSARLLANPQSTLHQYDADEFLGSGPYSGFGVLDAIAFLRSESRAAPITVLTDPWWGPPTDAVFAYLNGTQGIALYEAWWLQLDGEYPLVPTGPMPVWKSQYERIASGEVDFSAMQRLYYITDTNYTTPDSMHDLMPEARLLRRFPKPNSSESIDVYRCR